MAATWMQLWKANNVELKNKTIGWRTEPTIHKVRRPSRLDRARRLGYKAKQGIVIVRARVGRGGMRKQRPVAGRRPKHLGVVHIKQGISMQKVAERRVNEKFPNMEVIIYTKMACTSGTKLSLQTRVIHLFLKIKKCVENSKHLQNDLFVSLIYYRNLSTEQEKHASTPRNP